MHFGPPEVIIRQVITFLVPQEIYSVSFEEAFVGKNGSWIVKIGVSEQSHVWWSTLEKTTLSQ